MDGIDYLEAYVIFQTGLDIIRQQFPNLIFKYDGEDSEVNDSDEIESGRRERMFRGIGKRGEKSMQEMIVSYELPGGRPYIHVRVYDEGRVSTIYRILKDELILKNPCIGDQMSDFGNINIDAYITRH